MRFNLVDRIVELDRGKRIRMVKNLTLGEEYLADHFPTFPVMPGVLMLQALVEASSWLLRISDEFRHSVMVLREAKNVKYGNFVDPGRTLLLTSELVERTDDAAGEIVTFKGKGEVDGTATVAAKLTLCCYNLRDRNPAFADVDSRIINHLRGQYTVLQGSMAG
jgi:3-hydroxyacyl-[acyl-carrier-protein] dehydratase